MADHPNHTELSRAASNARSAPWSRTVASQRIEGMNAEERVFAVLYVSAALALLALLMGLAGWSLLMR